MYTSIKLRNMTDAALPPFIILLAESSLVEIERIGSTIDPEFRPIIKIAHNYHELLESLIQERPQIVILGRIDIFNYLEICQGCHKIREQLPIVLLSKQEVISDSYRQLVKTCGLTDAITHDPVKLNQLLLTLTLHKTIDYPSIEEPFELITGDEPINQRIDNKLLELAVDELSSQQLLEPLLTGRMMLAGLEEIVAISNNYFGPLAQGNYWRKAHACIIDEFPSIENWSADHFSKLSCNDNILDRELTTEDLQSLRIWVQFFIKECERIIVDFKAVLNQSAISPLAKDLLANP
jgi:hypothetical protein